MTDTCIVCLGDLRVDEAEAIEGVVKPSLRHDDYLNRHEEEAAALDAGADTALSAAPHPTNANNQRYTYQVRTLYSRKHDLA